MQDHPRSRGVYYTSFTRFADFFGSSPLARGLHDDHAQHARQDRIIPARAGFTRGGGEPRRPRPDHPRSRGVYVAVIPSGRMRCGSSPLARGLPSCFRNHAAPTGIIPARAGFTWSASALSTRPGDHPRSRGVYSEPPARRRYRTGSSPLARGLPRHERAHDDVARIIPARAGFT